MDEPVELGPVCFPKPNLIIYNVHISLSGRRKKGRGGGERKSPIPSFSPSTLSPTRFDACYAGFVHDWSLPGEPITQQEEKKR